MQFKYYNKSAKAIKWGRTVFFQQILQREVELFIDKNMESDLWPHTVCKTWLKMNHTPK